MRTSRIVVAAGVAALGTACAEGITSSRLGNTSLAAAFTSTPSGFTAVSSSFNGSPNTSATFRADDHGGRGDHGGGGQCGANGLLLGHDFMGGGFGDDYLGGRRDGGRPFDGQGQLQGNCAYNAASGTTTCTSTRRDGLSVTRTYLFRTAAGASQQTPDSTTNIVTVHTAVTGTATRRDGVTVTVNHTSDRTVTGLAKGSTQRTVNGTLAGTENLAGHDSVGSFTAVRVIGDSTRNLVIPVTDGHPTYPTAGTVIRAMQVSVTRSTGTTSSSRREVVTYDGSSTATLVITHDGATKTCKLPLPHGRPQCE